MRDGPVCLEAQMTQKDLMKILNEYLEIKMPILDDNTKMEWIAMVTRVSFANKIYTSRRTQSISLLCSCGNAEGQAGKKGMDLGDVTYIYIWMTSKINVC